MKKEIEIDIKNNLKKYLPSIFLLLGNNSINWKKITEKYQEILYSRKEKLLKSEKGVIHVEACLLDVISKVVQQDYSFLNLLKLFDETFFNLSQKTTIFEKKLLKQTVFNVLVNTNKNYLNFIGEFLVLNNLKNAGFELLKTEEPLSMGEEESTRVDFTVKIKECVLLVEVLNIHLPDKATLTDELIERLLIQKITHKLIAKQKDSHNKFNLIPVLWGEYEAIEDEIFKS